MDNQQLQEYVRAQLGAGNTKDAIQRSLLSSGWTQPDIDTAFGAVAGDPGKTITVGRISKIILRDIGIAIVALVILGIPSYFIMFSKTHSNTATIATNANLIQRDLSLYKAINKSFPISLDQLSSSQLDPAVDKNTTSGFSYQVEQGGKDYKLCSSAGGKNACATASTAIDGTTNLFQL